MGNLGKFLDSQIGSLPFVFPVFTESRYEQLFQPIMSQVMERYRPGAVVMQCGADSLAGCKNQYMKIIIRKWIAVILPIT